MPTSTVEPKITWSQVPDENPIEVGGALHHLSSRESNNFTTMFEFSIRPSRIPAVIEQLRQKGSEASWVVFMFYTSRPSVEEDNCPALQYSIQNGKVGLDWVLLGPRNIADKSRIENSSQAGATRLLKWKRTKCSIFELKTEILLGSV